MYIYIYMYISLSTQGYCTHPPPFWRAALAKTVQFRSACLLRQLAAQQSGGDEKTTHRSGGGASQHAWFRAEFRF